MALGHWLKDYIGPHSGGSGGGGGGVLIVNGVIDGNNTMTLDRTWQEIHDARVAVLVYEPETDVLMNAQLYSINFVADSYNCTFVSSNNVSTSTINFHADSPNGYPKTT